MNLLSSTPLSTFAIALLLVSNANAQIQTQPIEVITAAPPATFSQRAGYWPTEEFSQEVLVVDKASLNDRWNSVPGVQAREAGSPTISIRGSALADRVLKLVEGAALNMSDGVGGSDLLIPTEVMSRVSLLKGPSSVFYGNAAMAGAIDHRIRYFDRAALKTSIADEGGQLGSRSAALILPYANRSETVRAQASLFHENVPGNYQYESVTSANSGRRESNSSELTRGTIAADARQGVWNFSTRLVATKAVGEAPGSLSFPFRSTFDTDATLATVEISRTIRDAHLVSLRLTDTRIDGLYDEATASEATSFTARTALNADLRSLVTDTLLVRTFLDLASNRLHASYLQGRSFEQTDADIGQSYEISLSPALSLQPAYRYQSRYGKVFKAVGLVRSSENKTQFITFGEGFRAPSLTDRYASYSTFQGNPNLKPETSWALEAGASLEQGKRYGGFLEGLGLRGSAYLIKFDDIVDTQTNGPVLTKINSGKAKTLGAEFSAAYGFEEWMFSFGYNYLDARNETAREPLRLSPDHQAVITVAQLFGPILIEARETLWSSFYDRDPAAGTLRELPSWQTFDLTFRTLGLTDWELRGGVLNLFKENREFTIGYPEPQRRLFISALRYF